MADRKAEIAAIQRTGILIHAGKVLSVVIQLRMLCVFAVH